MKDIVPITFGFMVSIAGALALIYTGKILFSCLYFLLAFGFVFLKNANEVKAE